MDVRSYVGGLAGRDISPMTIQKVFEDLGQEASGDGVNWIDCKDDPMHLREVPLHV